MEFASLVSLNRGRWAKEFWGGRGEEAAEWERRGGGRGGRRRRRGKEREEGGRDGKGLEE